MALRAKILNHVLKIKAYDKKKPSSTKTSNVWSVYSGATSTGHPDQEEEEQERDRQPKQKRNKYGNQDRGNPYQQ